jgi:hypothetical protein
MTNRLKWILMVGALVAVIAIGGGVASAVSGGGNGEQDDGRDDTPVTGSRSDEIRAAALKATDGGRVLEAEPDGDPGGGDGDRGEQDDADSPDEARQAEADNERDYAYEVTVEQPDGKVVEVQLDKDLKPHGTDTED